MVTRAVPLKTNLSYVFSLFFNSKLQSVVLQQQSFLQKCETWMEFLTQTEQKLTAEISGNYQSLLEQQRDHEVRGLYKHTHISLLLWLLCGKTMFVYSYSRQRCLAGSKFSIPSSTMAIIYWTKDQWMTGKGTLKAI